MLERAARRSDPAPALGLGSCLWAATSSKAVRGAAGRERGLGVVGRGELPLARASERSAPRA